MSNIAGHLAYGKNILSNSLAIENPAEYSAIMDNLKNDVAVRSPLMTTLKGKDAINAPTDAKPVDGQIITTLTIESKQLLLPAPSDKKPALKYEFKANTYECKAPTGSYQKSCTFSK